MKCSRLKKLDDLDFLNFLYDSAIKKKTEAVLFLFKLSVRISKRLETKTFFAKRTV